MPAHKAVTTRQSRKTNGPRQDCRKATKSKQQLPRKPAGVAKISSSAVVGTVLRRSAKRGTTDNGVDRRHEPRFGTKLATIIAKLKQPDGITIDALAKATGWQRHSVHGLISGTIRTRMGIKVATEVRDGIHYYRIAE